MKPSPQPHPQPKSLDDLIANAEHFADFCMRNSGSVTPALFFLGPDGQGMFCPESLKDGNAKDDFADNARLVCIAHAATACAMTLESWMKTAQPGETLDMTEAPSEAFDRREVIVLMGESQTGQKQKSCRSSGVATASSSALANLRFRSWTRSRAASRSCSRRKFLTPPCATSPRR